MKIEFNNKTLVFSVDMNNGFCKYGDLYSPRVEKLIPDTEKFLKACIKENIDIVAFTDSHSEKSPEFSGYPVHCLENSEESKLVDEISFLYDYKNAKVIPKASTNGIFAMDISALDKYDNFVITGCCTDICVYQLALSIKTYFNQKNICKDVVVLKNLVETYDAPGHNAEQWNKIFFDSMLLNGVQVEILENLEDLKI